MVPEVGLEPTRAHAHTILSRACLPVPPLWPTCFTEGGCIIIRTIVNMPHPDPKSDQKKTNGTLNFSDLGASQPAKPVTAPGHIPQADTPFNMPTSPDTPSHQPSSTPPTPEAAAQPATADIPVFRNPDGASHTADLFELGAKPPAPIKTPEALEQANQLSSATPTPKVRLNLSPAFDTFTAHGLHVEAEGSTATTLLGKIANKLHLKSLFSRRNLRYAGVGLASFAVFLLIFNFGTIGTQVCYTTKASFVCRFFSSSPPQAVAPIATPSASPAAAINQAEPIDSPDVIIIPKLNVNAPIVLEPSIAEQAIQASLRNGVVHYAGTALPGEPSNVVIVGHSSNDWWEPGNYKFVFALLDKLAPGDQIQINYQKRKYVYQVAGSKVVEPTEISVLQPTTQPILTLITCTPPGTSWKRLIITANQIQPSPVKPEDKAAVAITTNDTKAALPGNAPSFFDQVKSFFGFGKPTESKTPSPSQSPAAPKRNYLPEPA